MSEVCAKMIVSTIMPIYSFFIARKIIKSDVKIYNIKSIIGILTIYILTVALYKIQYTSMSTVAIFALQVIVYKEIFNIKIEESLIACGMLMALIIFCGAIISIILRNMYTFEEIRREWYLGLTGNILVAIFSLIIIGIKFVCKQFQSFYDSISKKKSVSNILFIILLIVGLSTIVQNISKINELNNYLTNGIVMIIYFVLTYIFIRNRNNYDKLNVEYENLFTYVQNFEDWNEKEQLNRHEYKNQLAVLRCLTTEKKVKDKIDEILEDSINIEGAVVHQLKMLPKGGIKGLMYYKSAIAQKNKIDLEVDISLETHSILEKLPEKDIKTLCRLIGIYFDNAIEAARETRKKKVLVEVYEIKDHVTFVFSNTFKKAKNFDDRNKKGVSSKGKGHGNGLYFASKLIKENPWLSGKQEVIDRYYIQQLTITKKDVKK